MKTGYIEDNSGSKPRCGCCDKECVIIANEVVRLCHCDPDGLRCHACARVTCHCRCKPAQVSPELAAPAGILLDLGQAG